jgi:hypothetical protein
VEKWRIGWDDGCGSEITPSIVTEVVMLKRGLVLVVGATGSGKSTSLAAMIDQRCPHAVLSSRRLRRPGADGLGRVLLLQETPPRVELIDPKALKVVASIDLAVEGRGEIARAWSDPKRSSGGEGAVLLPGGHLLVAKEKKPAAFIEFGPPHSRSRGLVRGGALSDGERWPIKKGHHRFIALAIWLPDKTLAKTCADFSDLEIGPDGYLYLLSDKSSTIARLDDLPAGGGTAALLDAWRLGDLDGKPEGLAFTAQGRAIVGLDTRKPRRNLVLLEPTVARLRGRGQSLNRASR